MAAGFAAAVTLSWPFARGQGFLLALSLFAMFALVLGVGGYWVRGLAWGLALLATTFLVRLQLEPAAISAWTPVAAGLLLLVAELGYWSFELDGSSMAITSSASAAACQPRVWVHIIVIARPARLTDSQIGNRCMVAPGRSVR